LGSFELNVLVVVGLFFYANRNRAGGMVALALFSNRPMC
jgi:hypothetical protein